MVDNDMERSLRVLWSRGKGCADLAGLLDDEAMKLSGDAVAESIVHRADFVVAKRFSSFDAVPTLVPFDIDLEAVDNVAALVSHGPHSQLAAQVARRLGGVLGVRVRVECAYEEGGEMSALELVERIVSEMPGTETGIIRASSAAEVIEDLGDGTLLVLGAPGGSFVQRQFFGKGARLIAKSSIGAVGVKAVPVRAFRRMSEPVYVSPHMGAGDVTRLMSPGLLAVVENGTLIGSVTTTALQLAGPGVTVADCLREPVFVDRLDSLEDVAEQFGRLGVGALPVTDGDMRLLGTINSSDGAS